MSPRTLSLGNFDRTMIVDERWARGADGMMEETIVKVIDVAVVKDRGVTAVWAVLVAVVRMGNR